MEYGGEETYLNLKMRMWGYRNYCNPEVYYLHYSTRQQKYHWSNDTLFRNAAMVAYILGGQEWSQWVLRNAGMTLDEAVGTRADALARVILHKAAGAGLRPDPAALHTVRRFGSAKQHLTWRPGTWSGKEPREMSGAMPRIMLFGELPDVVVDMPVEQTAVTETNAPIKQFVMGYTLERVARERGVIRAILCVRYRYILASGQKTAQEVVEVLLAFRRRNGVWLCEVEKAK